MIEYRLLTPEQVAEHLGIAVKTVKDYLREGVLPGVKIGKRIWRIRPEDLQAFIEARVTGASESQIGARNGAGVNEHERL